MFNKKDICCYFAYIIGLIAFALFVCPPALAHVDPDIDIREFVSDSDFIFKGQVTNIAYRNSEAVQLLDPKTGAPLFDPNGNPLYEDGTNIPHTFVTYQIEEIYKGMAPQASPGGPPDSNVTLRFLGGQSQDDTSEYLMVSNIPLFDVNDRDFLFVKGNTEESCPLVHWFGSRLRILSDPCDPNVRKVYKIYNELGLEVINVPGGGAAPSYVTLGPFHSFEQINTHDMGEFILKKVTVDEDNEFDLPGANDVPESGITLGSHFTEDAFEPYLTQIVLAECGTVPPESCGIQVASADVSQAFTARPFPVTRPIITTEDPAAYSRPWLDMLEPDEKDEIMEAERLEHEMLLLTRFNPVLPANPCEVSILKYGAMAGDVSGPKGKPDCQVNFYDVAEVVGKNWLKVAEPGLPLFPICIE
ncbi:MAG: hypothetical protein FVQ85_12500 [Planctomycetes bacterium]|nr:hypothetical protein [Planctomycetota bacterium]